MSYIISEECGSCAGVPVRNSWGMPVAATWWNTEAEMSGNETVGE
jgi:hypothetical protein